MITTIDRPATFAAHTSTTLPGVLTPDQIRRAAPSVYAETPWDGMSDRYGFVPTSAVLATLAGEGFHPVRAMQSRSRIPGKSAFTRHMIRFRHTDYLRPFAVLGAEIPEIVLTNSHDGTSAYQLAAGIFRLICTNGMVVQSRDFGTVSVRHSGSDEFGNKIIDATYEVLGTTALTMDRIEQWKSITMSPPQRLALADAATELRPNGVRPDMLLHPKRAGDNAADLWTTVNVIQENFIRGGVIGRNVDTGRRFRTRPVNSVGEDMRINRGLWTLAESAATILA